MRRKTVAQTGSAVVYARGIWLIQSMRTGAHDPEWHPKHPRTRRWMTQCARCRRWGYRHDAPWEFLGRPHMEESFEELKLDSRDLCHQCQGALSPLLSSPQK